jgi:hypothetical protein
MFACYFEDMFTATYLGFIALFVVQIVVIVI